MKKKDSAGLGMTIPKRMRMAGMTFYLRNGQVVGRESSTHEKRSNTLPQFIQRQKMRHTTALWKFERISKYIFKGRIFWQLHLLVQVSSVIAQRVFYP